MRKLYFLVPGTDGKFACGGLWAELKTVELTRQICHADVVTYRQREQDKLFLDDLLQEKNLDDCIFVISWGFDVPKLSTKLKSCHVVYHAHTTGYGFSLPAKIPIITVSRNSMGYWGQHSPNSLIYYLPNQIADEFHNYHQQRNIDVLVLARKSSTYLIKQLVPELQKRCHVSVINSYIDDVPGLFNQAKIYLYDSAEYWALQGVSEGFGLQPLEAMACGCQVFSSINGGLSDYLDPGFNCYKIAAYSTEFDVQRILKLLDNWQPSILSETFLEEYRAASIINKLRFILDEINTFFDSHHRDVGVISNLNQIRLARLKLQSVGNKIAKRLHK
jgi:glycosyltransferase involved in cell wall biosynthesis